MIAQLKQTLERNSIFENRSNEKISAETSIKERLKLLKNSANLWQEKKSIDEGVGVTSKSSGDISTGLRKFFAPTSSSLTSTSSKKFSSEDECKTIDLDEISAKAAPILKAPKRARAPNRKNAIIDERYRLEVVKIDEETIEKEEQVEKLKTQAQTIAALKNAKESLKKSTKKSQFPDLMVIQIRGSKHTDVRLVAPFMSSIHENGCFLIVNHENLIKYEGKNSNILERTKAAQLCIEILGKSDLNCSAETIVTLKDAQNSSILSKLLATSENVNPSAEKNNNKHDDATLLTSPTSPSNESFEVVAARINLVLRIDDEQRAQTCSRRERLSINILNADETLILDFGSEIYVWTGRKSTKIKTAYAVEYAKQLMKKSIKNGKSIIGEEEEEEGMKRPDWILFRKIHQGVLDVLFKSKFYDWPESKEVLLTCRPKSMKYEKSIEKPIDMDEKSRKLAEKMVKEEEEKASDDPILMIEDQEIHREMKNVVTEKKIIWKLNGEQLKEEAEFITKFETTTCFVLKWQYRIQKSGVRRIVTGKEEERETGRSRIAYFYWLGDETTPKQHGLCALRIKDLDKENSPRIRVVDGNEPALFLALFDGKFVVRCGGESEKNENSTKSLFAVIGANQKETSLREIKNPQNYKLRSHATYIETSLNISNKSEKVKLLCGASSSEQQVKLTLAHAEHFPTTSKEQNVEVEGDMKTRRWIKSTGRTAAMKIWRIFENEAEKLSFLNYHKNCSFTFAQNILTETILIDVGDVLWLWCENAVSTFALKVAKYYGKEKSTTAPTTTKMMVVKKGEEPDEFQAMFLNWQQWNELSSEEEIRMVAAEEKEEKGKARLVEELLAERCKTFSLEELKNRENLPAGMDMRRLENYLSDNDFQEVFQMSRSEFYEQKSWKQNEQRKKVGLF